MCLKIQQKMQQARFQKRVQTSSTEPRDYLCHDMIVATNTCDDMCLVFPSSSCCAAVLFSMEAEISEIGCCMMLACSAQTLSRGYITPEVIGKLPGTQCIYEFQILQKRCHSHNFTGNGHERAFSALSVE